MGGGVIPVLPDATGVVPQQQEYTPADWQEYLNNAMRIFHQSNGTDREALEAIHQANQVLNSFDAPDIAKGDKLEANIDRASAQPWYQNAAEGGVGAAKGLLWDPLVGLTKIPQMLRHPEQIAQIPGNILEGLTSGDPQQTGRAIGNVGGFALPYAKIGAKGPSVASAFSALPRSLLYDIPRKFQVSNELTAARTGLANARTEAVLGKARPGTSEPPIPSGRMVDLGEGTPRTSNPLTNSLKKVIGNERGGGIPEPVQPPLPDPMPDIEIPQPEPFGRILTKRQAAARNARSMDPMDIRPARRATGGLSRVLDNATDELTRSKTSAAGQTMIDEYLKRLGEIANRGNY